MLPEQQQRILGYFIEEAKEHLTTIEQGLLSLQSTLNDPETLNEVFRAAHSVKGGAAMLGLSSIQRTSHRLEDCFKVLKEQPVKVDQKLETLFLDVFDTLAALIEHLQGPFGLTEEVANNLMSDAEPCFQSLHEHLDMLVKRGSAGVKNTSQNDEKDSAASQQITSPQAPVESYGRQQLQTQVLQTLRQMLQLFKQQETPDNRQQLQDCCQHLAELGEEVNLANWSALCLTARAVIANPSNSYLVSAKVVITSIKQALELILADRETEIVANEQLEALIGDVELLNLANVQEFEKATPLELMPQSNTSTANIENNIISSPNLESEDVEPENNIHNLFELFGQENNNNDGEGSFSANKKIHPKGPGVGSAELNTLANLFAYENSELDDKWEQQELSNTDSSVDDAHLDLNSNDTEKNDHEFDDLLFFDAGNKNRKSLDNKSDDKEVIPDDVTLVNLLGENSLNNLNQESVNQDLESNETLNLDIDRISDNNKKQESPDDFSIGEVDVLNDINELLEIKDNGIIPPWETITKQEDSNFENLFPDGNQNEKGQQLSEDLSGINTSSIDSKNGDAEDNIFIFTDEGNDIPGEISEENDLFNLLSTPENISSGDKNIQNLDQNRQQLINDEIEQENIANSLEESLFSAADSGEIFGEQENTDINSDSFPLEPTIFQEFLPLENQINSPIMDDLSPLEPTIFQEFLPLENQTDSPLIDDLSSLESTIFQESSPAGRNENTDKSPHTDHITSPPPEVEKVLSSEVNTQKANASQDSQIDFNDGDLLNEEVGQENVEEQILNTNELSSVDDTTEDNIPVSSTSASVTTKEAQIGENLDSDLPVTTNETTENISTKKEDDFADLEALINEDTSSLSNANVEAKNAEAENAAAEFANLEALLDLDTPELAIQPEKFQESTKKEVESDTVKVSNDDAFADGFKDLEEMLKVSAPSQAAESPKRNSNSRVSRFEQLMKVPVKHLDDMSNLVGELVVNRNSLEQDQERLRQSLDNLLHQVHQLSDVGLRMQELYEHSLLEASLLASRKNKNSGRNEENDRGLTELEIDRFTPFHTLSQQMIELIVRVRESSSDIDFVVEETEQVARQFRQVTTQLQEGLTRSRMEPFSIATDILPRGVRDNAIKSGKQVKLDIQGRDTLIDKMILEHLGNPLNHLLNNAIAHGIETPEERIAAGKDETGTINVSAFHQGNQTVISVSDDGAGIDPAKVKAKALKMGLITPEEAKTLSPTDTYELLFHPGFSTKEKADMLGGRGVGMDVVRTKIGEIRGIINVDSTVGQGTRFTIRLPLTLSICKALFCVSNKARIAFPMDGVEDTLDIHSKQVQYNMEGQGFIKWHDTNLPFKPLKDLLTFNRQLSRGNVYGGNRDDEMISAIIVRSANTLLALEVDQVLNEQEIAIKQFEGPAPKPIGVAGATVLGDGRIMPIADVLEIMDIFHGRTSKQSGVSSFWEQNSPPVDSELELTKSDPTVLIVDDSITVRELLSLTFNKAGYRVEQARDGQEAWDKLRSGLPCDLVFCDIEMPRCDGLELLSRIQKDSNLQNLPIAMLTSRGADKHRKMAVELGASGYFTKPYLEEALLEAATKMLNGENLVSNS